MIIKTGNPYFYKKLLLDNGADYQRLKAIEELVELQEVLIKDVTKHKYTKEKVLEEMAHVLMVFQSLKNIYGISDNMLSNEIHRKLKILKKKEE